MMSGTVSPWDSDAGLSYAQQRWYEPRVGRFLSEDPVFGDLGSPNALHSFGYANGNPLSFLDPSGERAATEAEAIELALWERSANNYRDQYQRLSKARQFLSRQAGMWGGTYSNWKLLEDHVVRRRAAIEAAADGQAVEAVLGFDPNLVPLPESRKVELTGGGASATFIIFAKYQPVPKRNPSADALAMVALSPPSAVRAIIGEARGETEENRDRAVMMNGGPWLLATLFLAPVESSSRSLLPEEPPGLVPGRPPSGSSGAPRSKAQGQRVRLPQDGTWTGEPGESVFIPTKASKLPFPDDPYVVDLEPGQGVPFRNGRPDLSRWAWDEFDVPGLDGSKQDQQRMALAVAERYKLSGARGRPTAAAGFAELQRLGLVPHHAGGARVQLLPHGLHGSAGGRVGVPHIGGASDLRTTNGTVR